MAFKDFPEQNQGVRLLQRSLERGRLGHAYLFAGHELDGLESAARTLAKTLNCQRPVRAKQGNTAIDCCDECLSCRKVDGDNHPDVFWVRPESRLRQIRIGQITHRPESPPRVLLDAVNLKPTESEFKMAVIVAADRMNEAAANSFLKTLEEPPSKSVLILLSTAPERLLETILSRCLRLNFDEEYGLRLDTASMEWLERFSEAASAEQKSLIGRYGLIDVFARRLTEIRAGVEESMTARSPLERYEDVEKELRERWEEELKAVIEAEYRRRRATLLLAVQWWLRDVWLHALSAGRGLLHFPKLTGAEKVARRIGVRRALGNLEIMEDTQRLLHTNVQEMLALEVGLLKLHL